MGWLGKELLAASGLHAVENLDGTVIVSESATA